MPAQSKTTHQQKTNELYAATVRALSNNSHIHYRRERLYQGNTPLPFFAAHIQSPIAESNISAKRGNIDAISLRLNHSDIKLHQQLSPTEPIEKLLFELLEQFRVETCIPTQFSGMKANIQHNFSHWAEQFHHTGLTDTHLGLLLYTVAQITRSRLMALPVSAHTEDFIESTRAAIVPILGGSLSGLRRCKNSQENYAQHALELARIVSDMIQAEMQNNPDDAENRTDQKTLNAFSLLLDFDSDECAYIAAVVSGSSKIYQESHQHYRVFTTQYDREIEAATLVRNALLIEYREKLDKRIQHQGINIRHIARQLAAILCPPQRNGWSFDEEEGHLDGRRLSQLISSPAERRLFCTEQYTPHSDSIVSFLIDCSGSMREHIENITIIIDIMVKALGMAGITSEVLGFTTNAWNGGKAYSDWINTGRPAFPGRLNETCHLIFKDADTNWRRSRKNIAALLKADLFREGIDGEAIEWACNRMLLRKENRRILCVISDGCPMDTATNLSNDKFYLDNHLKDVISRFDKTREVDILGLGVGLDLSLYYRKHLAIETGNTIDNALFHRILKLIASLRR
jgi:cobaltochelatase CobT